GNNRLPVVPRHYTRGELRYDNGDGAYVAPNVEWVPEAFNVDNANTTKSNTYVLFGMKTGYRVTPQFNIFLDGRNLADKTYIADAGIAATATAASALFNPGTGRTVIGGFEIKF